MAVGCLCANAQRVPNKKVKVGSYTFTMVYVEGGTFQMGSDSYKRERPRHTVSVDDFYIGETEVTQVSIQKRHCKKKRVPKYMVLSISL